MSARLNVTCFRVGADMTSMGKSWPLILRNYTLKIQHYPPGIFGGFDEERTNNLNNSTTTVPLT